MLALMFAALVDTVIAPVPGLDVVYVHEWGAVTFVGESVFFSAGPLEGEIPPAIPPDLWDEPLARAPVVYFYGTPFSGTFRVSVTAGDFVELVPAPSSLMDNTPMPTMPTSMVAEWWLSGDMEGPTSALPEAGYLECVPAELMESWRTPPSHQLQFQDGSTEKFVYYECSLASQGEDAFRPVVLRNGTAELSHSYQGQAVRFRRTDGAVTAQLMDAGEPVGRIDLDEDSGEMVELLCGWADGTMKTAELQAMWDTWAGWVTSGEWETDHLVMFPFPAATVEGMTTIQLLPDQFLDVEYTRFYVGFIQENAHRDALVETVSS